MTHPDRALLYLGCVLCALAAVLAVHASSSSHARDRYAAYAIELGRELAFLRLPASGAQLAVAQAVLVTLALLAAAWWSNPALGLVAIPVALVPRAWLAQRRAVRVAAIEAQLDTWLTTLANALKANPALGDALQSSLALTAAPLCDEIDLVVKRQRLGTPLDVALAELAERVASRVVTSTVSTLRIARQTGGNLGATLESSAASLRELARLEGIVRTRTAEGRAQALLIGALPVPLFLVLDLVEPTFLAPLWADARGHAVVAVAVLLWGIAFAWARHIVAVDV